MELIELDATAQRALELLTNAGMSDGSIYDYTEMKRAAIQKADAVRGTKPVPDEIWADNEEMILKLSGLL